MAGCLLMLSGCSLFGFGRIWRMDLAVFALWRRGRLRYAGPIAIFIWHTLTILHRLWAVQASRNSIFAPLNPPRSSLRNPKGPLIWPNTGSTIVLRLL